MPLKPVLAPLPQLLDNIMIMEKFELPITSSPVPSSSFSELTAVSAGTAEDLDRQSKERLGRYVAASERDNVVQLMDAFMKYLPKDGSVRLMQDVISLDEDEKLRQLKEHLVDAILKPSKNNYLLLQERHSVKFI